MSAEYKRLLWRCRRGMKELDVALEYFVANAYPTLDEAGRDAFERLLGMEDPEIYACLLGRQQAPDAGIQDVIDTIRSRA